jgi:uncharacterized protein (TIGR02271 family)
MTSEQAGEMIPLLKEELRVDKRSVVTGKVRVRSVVDTIDELVHAALTDERVEVTRVPMDREVEAAPSVRTEGDVTIVPIMEEVLVVEKPADMQLLLEDKPPDRGWSGHFPG